MYDPFSILGLSPATATFPEARERYRALSRSHHPDLASGDAGLMARLTEAWRGIRTPAAFEEVSRAVRARRAAADSTPVADPHLHDVYTHDGLIHLGPYTRGAMARAVSERTTRAGKAGGGVLSRLSGRKTAPVDAPIPVIPAAFSLTAERLTLHAAATGRSGPHLAGLPSVRLVGGQMSYSGKVVETRSFDLCDGATGVVGLGLMEIGDARQLDILLVLETGA